jgi:hypothetical protein
MIIFADFGSLNDTQVSLKMSPHLLPIGKLKRKTQDCHPEVLDLTPLPVTSAVVKVDDIALFMTHGLSLGATGKLS